MKTKEVANALTGITLVTRCRHSGKCRNVAEIGIRQAD
jgi:hypothetical protein